MRLAVSYKPFNFFFGDFNCRNGRGPRRELRSMSSSSKTTQKAKFIEKARELGCDEDEAAFEKRLRKIAKAEPKASGVEPAPKKRRTS